MNDLAHAKELLNAGDITCVFCRGGEVYKSAQRGVASLLAFIDSGTNLRGFAAADLVVGSAAAYLYALLGVKSVYAPVMSGQAKVILEQNGIKPSSKETVGFILNRGGTGLCPMENAVGAVSGIIDPDLALKAVRECLAEMKKRTVR